MEAENSSETSVTLYRSAWHHIPDVFNLHHHRRADITSHITTFLNAPRDVFEVDSPLNSACIRRLTHPF